MHIFAYFCLSISFCICMQTVFPMQVTNSSLWVSSSTRKFFYIHYYIGHMYCIAVLRGSLFLTKFSFFVKCCLNFGKHLSLFQRSFRFLWLLLLLSLRKQKHIEWQIHKFQCSSSFLLIIFKYRATVKNRYLRLSAQMKASVEQKKNFPYFQNTI